jgi:CHRD domain
MKLPSLVFAALMAVAGAAHAGVVRYSATLTGATETVPNASTATGFATVDYDDALHTLLVHVEWSGLIGGPATAGHIHCCAPTGANAIVAIGFGGLANAVSGVFDQLFDLTLNATYGASFLVAAGGTAAGAEARLAAGLAAPDHRAYVNIHNLTFPGGEIRGALIPEPGALALSLAALLAIGAVSRRRPAAALKP